MAEMFDRYGIKIEVTGEPEAQTALTRLGSAQKTLTEDVQKSAGAHQTLEEKIARAVTAKKEHIAVTEGVTKELEKEAGAVKNLGVSLESLLTHWRALSAASKTAGLEMGSSVSKVGGGLDALVTTAKAGIGPMFGIAAALSAITGEAALLWESVKAADAFDQQVEQLRNTLKNLGADYAKDTEEIKRYAEFQAQTTTFTATETLTAYNKLLLVLGNETEARKGVNFAQTVAIKTHTDLMEVVGRLVIAEAGRTQGLKQLGLQTVDANGVALDMQGIMRENAHLLSDDVAAALDTVSGKSQNLGAQMESLKVTVGEVLEPAFKQFLGWMATEGINDLKAFILFMAQLEFQAHRAAEVVHAVFDLSRAGNVDDVKKAWGELMSSTHEQAPDMGSVFGKIDLGPVRLGHEQLAASVRHVTAATKAMIAELETARIKGDISANQEIESLRKLDKQTGVTAAMHEELAKKIAALQHGMDSAAHHAESLAAHQMAQLSSQAKVFEEHFDITATELHRTDAEIEKLGQHIQKTFGAEQQKLIAEFNAGLELERKLAGNEKDEEALRKLEERQFKAYEIQKKILIDLASQHHYSYEKMKQDLIELGQVFSDNAKVQADVAKTTDEYNAKELHAIEERTKALEQWSDKSATYLEKFFQGGKKGSETLAHAFQDMIHKMEHALLQSILFRFITGQNITGGGFSSLLFGQATTGGGGVFSDLVGAQVGGSVLSSVAGATASVGGGDIAAAGLAAGASTSAGLATASSLGKGGTFSNASGSFGGIGSILGKDVHAFGGSATLGSMLLGAGGGFLVGSLINRGDSREGGAIGGAIGSLFGPVGAAIGAIGGSLIGSLFGDHFSKQNQPDKYLAGYGKFVADINGAQGTFGSSVVDPDPQYTGDKSLAYQIENYLKALGPQGMAGLSSSTQDIVKRMMALNPSLGHGGFGIANEKDDIFTLGSGAKIRVEDYMSLVQQFVSSVDLSKATEAPVFSVTHALPDYAGAVSAAGSYMPGGPTSSFAPGAGGMGGGGAGPVGSPIGLGGPMPVRPLGTGSGVVVNVNVTGSLIHQNNLAQYVSDAVASVMQSTGSRAMMQFGRS